MNNKPPLDDAEEPDTIVEELELLAAVRAALSAPKGRFAVLVRFSHLPAPLPRPHHRRTARVIIDEVAQQHEGEAFELECGDLVAVCRNLKQHGGDPALHPAALAHTFARLLRQDLSSGEGVLQVWDLERDGAALLAYVTQIAP